MNTPSPLIPQGSIQARGKSTVFFKVMMILAVHVVLIGGMLLQGCKDTKDNGAIQPATDTSATPPPATDTVPPAGATNPPPAAPGNTAVAPAPTVPPAPTTTAPLTPPGVAPAPAPVSVAPAPMQAPVTPTLPTAPAGGGEAREYVIVSGDTLGNLAHKNGVSLKTLLEANPGVNPKKLKVGQKIQIPAGTGSTASATPAAGGVAPETAGSDTMVYTVKTGDTLGKIAKSYHTGYKKIMALNDLKTTSIKIGQKLKLPAAAAREAAPEAPATAPVVPAPAAPVTPAPAPVTTASNQ